MDIIAVSTDTWQKIRVKSDACARAVLVLTAFMTPISTAAMNLGFALLLVFFLLSGNYLERLHILRKYPIVWFATGLFALICAGALWTAAPLDEAGWQISKYSKLLFVPVILVLAQNITTRNQVVFAVLLSLSITVFLSYVNAVHPLPAWLSRATREGVFDGNNYIFKHHIIQNVFLSVGALIAAVYATASRTVKQRFCFAVVAAGCVGSILFLAQGRTGYLTLFAAAMLLLYVWMMQFPKIRLWLILGAIALMTAAAASPAIHKRIGETLNSFEAYKAKDVTNAVAHRLVFWKASLDILEQHPWFGVGTGAHRQEILQRVQNPAFAVVGAYNPHNQFLYFGTQLGALGIAAYVALLVVLWKNTSSLPKQRQTIARGIVLILVVYSVFDSPLFITEGHFFIILIGTLWSGREAISASNQPAQEMCDLLE
jgi:O-antigen ligase